jgi:hypothetical protein
MTSAIRGVASEVVLGPDERFCRPLERVANLGMLVFPGSKPSA